MTFLPELARRMRMITYCKLPSAVVNGLPASTQAREKPEDVRAPNGLIVGNIDPLLFRLPPVKETL